MEEGEDLLGRLLAFPVGHGVAGQAGPEAQGVLALGQGQVVGDLPVAVQGGFQHGGRALAHRQDQVRPPWGKGLLGQAVGVRGPQGVKEGFL